MIFAIQTYVENYFNARGLNDIDQYSLSISKLYDRKRHALTKSEFLREMKRLPTKFYRQNNSLQRDAFERDLLAILDNRFKKKAAPRFQRPSQKELKPPAAA